MIKYTSTTKVVKFKMATTPTVVEPAYPLAAFFNMFWLSTKGILIVCNQLHAIKNRKENFYQYQDSQKVVATSYHNKSTSLNF